MGSVRRKKKSLLLKESTINMYNSNNESSVLGSLQFHLSQLKNNAPFYASFNYKRVQFGSLTSLQEAVKIFIVDVVKWPVFSDVLSNLTVIFNTLVLIRLNTYKTIIPRLEKYLFPTYKWVVPHLPTKACKKK